MSRSGEKLEQAKQLCRRRSGFFHPIFSGFLLCLFCMCSVVHSLGQNNPLSKIGPGQDEWFQRASFLQQKIAGGTTEEKRDALFEIRNIHTEQASRIAVPALKDRDEIVRATAASSVIFLPKEEAAAALVPLLNDRAVFVRREAAFALGTVDSTAATRPLIDLFQRDKDLEVRSAAAIALGKIGDVVAVEPLLTFLTRSRPTEDEEFLRRTAACSIGLIAQAVYSRRHRVVTSHDPVSEKYKDLGEPHGEDLTTQFPILKTASSALNKVLQDSREAIDTRREAAFSLGAIGDAGAVGILQAQRNSADPFLAEIAKEALLKIENRSRSTSNK